MIISWDDTLPDQPIISVRVIKFLENFKQSLKNNDPEALGEKGAKEMARALENAVDNLKYFEPKDFGESIFALAFISEKPGANLNWISNNMWNQFLNAWIKQATIKLD